jgi:spore maturation protein CgeB
MKRFKKKILIIGAKEKTSLEMMYYRAFKSIGATTTIFQIEKNTNNFFFLKIKKFFKLIYFSYVRNKLLKYIKKKSKNFDIVIVFKGIYLNADTLIKCKNISKKTLWVNIFADDPFNSQFIKESNYSLLNAIQHYDFFCIWSYRIFKKLKKIVKVNRLIYLPFAYDNFNHFSYQKKSRHRNLITFIGTLDNQRTKFLSKIKDVNLNIYGNNSYKYKKFFKNKNIKFYPEIYGEKMRSVMKQSLVSINILRKQNKYSHNMKTFEIPAMNCLMLTTRSWEQDILLPENKACFMYSSLKEFKKKLRYILVNQNKLAKVRSLGYKSIKKYTYIYRATQLLNEINKIKDKQ